MNKTVTANISGVVFHIETDAYEKLHNYLSTIRRYFKDSDGTEEIMADIEARIAELLKENLGLGRDVVTMENVKQVVEVMGEPEQYMSEDTSENEPEPKKQTSFDTSQFRSKKLYRDEDDRILGGVCSGLGYYFGIDRIWIRAAFILAIVLGFGTGIPVYIILWIIMPMAKTTSAKLEMRGKPINYESIGNTIKDEFNHFKKKVDGEKTAQFARKTESGLRRFFGAIGSVLILFFKFLSKLISVVLIIGGIAGLIVLLTLYVGGPFNMNIYNYDVSNGWTTDIAELFFSSPGMFYTGLIGLGLVSIIPLLGLIYLGLRLLLNIPSSNKTINLTAVALFVVGVIMICISATTTASEYTDRQKLTQKEVLTELVSDTLTISSLEDTYAAEWHNHDQFFIEGNQIFINEFSIDVVKSKTDQIMLTTYKSSRGRNRKEAGRRAENVMVNYEVDYDVLKISPLISAPYEDRYRNQQARMSIGIPVGQIIYLDPSVQEIIYDIENVYDMRDRYMMDHYWEMTEEGLICLDCTEDDRGYYEKSDLEEFEESLTEELEDLEGLLKDKLEELEQLNGLERLERLKGLEKLEHLNGLEKLERLKELKQSIEQEVEKAKDVEIRINDEGANITTK